MSIIQSSRIPLLLSNASKPSPFKRPGSRSHSTPVVFFFSKPRVSASVSTPRSGNLTALRSGSSEEGSTSVVESDRPPFDLDLAVVLAGFAFEAYYSPSENVGWREVDAAECQTVYLSESFLREVYDGQLFIKLKKGVNLPAMDPWGTSDPYVVLQLNGQVAKSKVKWATKDPTWNEDITLNIKISQTNILQVAAWDANLVTPHKRMGNAGINLDSLCDGNLHETVVELEGIGGGGQIYLEVKYKSYDEINKEKNWWTIPFVSDILMRSSLGVALRMVLGSESVNVSDFVQSAFGQLKPLYYSYLEKLPTSNSDKEYTEGSSKSIDTNTSSEKFLQERSSESSVNIPNPENESKSPNETMSSNKYFWKTFADSVNQSALKKLGLSLPEIKVWEGFDLLNRMSLQSQKIAEVEYIQSGLASPVASTTPETEDDEDGNTNNLSSTLSTALSSILDIRKASWDVLNQTEAILGAMIVLAANISQQKKETANISQQKKETMLLEDTGSIPGSLSDDGLMTEAEDGNLVKETKDVETGNITMEAEEMKKIFSSAESAMEAWAMLATSLGRNSFIKSEFEKICFLDNDCTDTQVAIWRDSRRRRLIIAFRGTEQARWKDLRTDLMLIPAGLNPERLGGDFKQELQVHSGFLNAYDSVRNRIMTLIKLSISYSEDNLESMPKWHVYITGHSLGGALATLLALELSSSRMAKFGAISVTMYNFGSPRVGNRRFAEVYNEKVKDSWRVVNHRDIIPTVPRLMGYCHVAQPVYLVAGDLKEALVNKELIGDEYQGDIIGESTPDVLVSEFMKGEKQLVENILQTEINLLRSIRDGTALMQHMEDFYYIMLLESVKSNYKRVDTSYPSGEGLPS